MLQAVKGGPNVATLLGATATFRHALVLEAHPGARHLEHGEDGTTTHTDMQRRQSKDRGKGGATEGTHTWQGNPIKASQALLTCPVLCVVVCLRSVGL
jgi:hypothetical protein